MYEIHKVGLEFTGENQTNATFVSLEKLSFETMPKWKEWDFHEADDEQVVKFPCLKELSIIRCPQLLGRLTSLKEVTIDGEGCSDVVSFPQEELGMMFPPSLTIIHIANFENLKCLSSKGFQNLTSLQHLSLYNCPNLTSLPKKDTLLSLLQLYISEYVPQDFREYTDNANKFKIFIPQDWQMGVGEPNGFKSITAFYPEEEAPNSNVSVVITRLGPDFTRMESFGKVEAFADTLFVEEETEKFGSRIEKVALEGYNFLHLQAPIKESSSWTWRKLLQLRPDSLKFTYQQGNIKSLDALCYQTAY
ncbi:hypothetical protein REPUB_Repub11eG0007200 [Reevesia pubescens]